MNIALTHYLIWCASVRALDEIYAAGLERVVLFASRARDEERLGSAHAMVVFSEILHDRWTKPDRLADLRIRCLFCRTGRGRRRSRSGL